MAKKQKRSPVKIPEKQPVFKDNPLYNYGMMLLFAVFIMMFTTFKISGDDDVFWHLATGKYIAETHHVPSEDIFGFVTQGQQWMPFEWGWDLITYGLYSAGGYTAISIFRTIVFLLIFFIFFRIMRKFGVSYTMIFLILLLTAFGIIDRLTPRPHIMSLLFFAVLIYLLTEYKYFNRKNVRILYFIPFLFLLWANIHMGVLAGALLLLVFFISELILFLKPDKFSTKEIPALTKKEISLLGIISAVSILVMLVNPNGIATYFYAYDHTKMKLLETINEWRSPFDSMFSGGFVTNIYKFFLFGGLFVLYYSYRKKDIFPGLLYIVFAVYSVRAVRFTVDYIIIITVFLAIALYFIICGFKSSGIKNLLSVNPLPKVLLELILIFMIFNIPNDKLYLETLKYYRVSGFGINSDFMPVQMFDFMRENKIPETGQRPLNHFGSGGYLVWSFPGAKNFIDSRNLNDEIFNEYNTLIGKGPGFEKKLKDYDFDYSIYLAPDLVRVPKEMENSIISYFSKNSDEWKLVFWDDKSFLFLKNEPKFKEIIDKYEYKYVTPYNFMYRKNIIDDAVRTDPGRVKSEIDRKLKEEQNGLIINTINNTFSKNLNSN
ncbi:MAG: hypothetical protein JSS91_05780 [Bacteroidetes bacterium]|nr:hypothetical protein [Bacteroidota bacterium]